MAACVRSPATALVLTTCVALTACAGPTDPPSEAPPAATDGGGASPPPAATASPTADPTPTLQPATGPRIETPVLALRFPRGWELYDRLAPRQYDARLPDGQHTVLYSSVDLIAPVSLAELTDLYADRIDWDAPPTRLAPVTVDGVRCFRLRGKRLGVPRDMVGAQRGRTAVHLSFEIGEPPARRERIIDSVLATVAWEPL